MREFKSCELTKLELKYDDVEIKLEKKKEVLMAPAIAQSEVPTLTQPYTAPTTCSSATVVVNESATEQVPQIRGDEIKSPMVGTVYTAPGPDEEPFVSIGKKVKKGDVLCIIEAMKLMNEVEAEIDGEIVEVLAKNETMVQFGEPLFVINPQG